METISVIIPVHNRHELFEKCICSVLAQKDKKYRLEIIVIDDGSSPKIKAKGIKIIRNTKAQGPVVARNLGLAKASGKAICLLDSDDIWKPGFLKNLLKKTAINKPTIATSLVNAHFETDVSLSERVVYGLVTLTRNVFFLFFYSVNNGRLPYQFLYLLRFSSMLFTKPSTHNIKLDKSFTAAEDWKFILDSIVKHKPEIVIVPKFLSVVTYSKNSLSLGRSNYFDNYYKLIKSMPRDLAQSFGIKLFKKYTDFKNG